MKKKPVKASTGTGNKPKIKKGGSSPRKPKKRTTAKFYDVKIRITAEEFNRGSPYHDGLKYLKKFVMDAYREKIKRTESNDKETKQKALISSAALLEPVIRELYQQGKLGYLVENK